MKKILALTVSLLALGLSQSTFAQDMGLAGKIIQARKANAALMKQYSWNCRSELIEDGKTLDNRIEVVTYGPDGNLVRSILNDQGAPLPRGFLRKRIAEKQKEDVQKYLVGLRSLLDQYTLPTAGKVLDFVTGATLSAPDANGLLQLTGNSVVVPGDTFTLSVDAATRQDRKVVITTTYAGSTVTATGTFKTLPGGLTFMAFGEVDVPDKQMVLQLQNFDYNQN